MSSNKKKIVHHESKSLWNYTLSPGWTEDEVQILKMALQYYGIGQWQQILHSRCLPGKSIGQIYMQTQRLLGQQSLGQFMGLHVDIEQIFKENMKNTTAMRKNNCIINTGDNPTQQERKRRIDENKKLYGLSKEQIKQIKLPKFQCKEVGHLLTLQEIENDQFTTLEIITHLENLKKLIQQKLQLEENGGGESQNSDILISVKKMNQSQYQLLGIEDHSGYTDLSGDQAKQIIKDKACKSVIQSDISGKTGIKQKTKSNSPSNQEEKSTKNIQSTQVFNTKDQNEGSLLTKRGRNGQKVLSGQIQQSKFQESDIQDEIEISLGSESKEDVQNDELSQEKQLEDDIENISELEDEDSVEIFEDGEDDDNSEIVAEEADIDGEELQEKISNKKGKQQLK